MADEKAYEESFIVEETRDYKEEEKMHKKREHLGELGAAAATLIAVHEKHQAKKDPEHAGKHKLEEETAAAAAVAAGTYAFREHHQKKAVEEEEKEKNHHHHHIF